MHACAMSLVLVLKSLSRWHCHSCISSQVDVDGGLVMAMVMVLPLLLLLLASQAVLYQIKLETEMDEPFATSLPQVSLADIIA